ncbi:MAG: acyl-CoA dehydrogenase family protein [Nitrospinaceae bacterium]
MSYVTRQQKDWIQMLYGGHENHDDFQTMLETFGTLVEKTVLPAEQKTEFERAKNPFKDFRERFREKEWQIKKGIDTIVAKSGQTGTVSDEVCQWIMGPVDEVGREIKNEQNIPDEVYRQITDFGLPGMCFSDELDGMGFPYPLFIAFLEILGKASPSVGVRYAISNTCAEGLRFNHRNGNLSEYGQTILKSLIAGEKLAAFGLTEASASGSNIMQEMTTRALWLEDEAHYVITGNKMYITNAGTADVYAVFARTSQAGRGEEAEGQGISLFLVERGMEGFRIGQLFEKRIVENSSLGELVFNEVRVPVENLVGKAGEGAKYAMRMLNSGRVTIAALAVGLAQRAFDEYMDTAVEGKKSADRHLVEYDRTKARIADMSVEINAARDLTYRAAWLKERYDAGPDDKDRLREYVIASNGAKLKASIVAMKACDYLVKIGGASSVVKETFSLKHYLDSFLYYFGEAVPEVLENVVSHMEVKKYLARKGL